MLSTSNVYSRSEVVIGVLTLSGVGRLHISQPVRFRDVENKCDRVYLKN
jgi:hypothetical protein